MSTIARVALVFSTMCFVVSSVAQSTSLNAFKVADPNPVIAGLDVGYTITVSTEGPDDAANVTLSDTLPAGTTFASLASPGGWTCTTPAAGAGGTVTCSIASFVPGSAVFTLVLHTDPALVNGSTLSNTATVTTTTPDPDANDNVATVDAIVEVRSDTGVAKSVAPDPAPIGGAVTFAIDYTAAGPSNAANATITDSLPGGLLFSSVTATGFTCTTPAVGANGTVTCTHPALVPGASGTITIVATVDAGTAAGTTFTNTATIVSDAVDSNGANDSSSDGATAQHVSDLAIAKSATPDPVPAGGSVTVAINVTASGPSVAPNVTVTDVLPPQTTFVSLAAPVGWSCTTPAVGANGTVTCTHASLPSGYADGFTLVVTVDSFAAAGTSVSNTAAISGDVVESTSNNSASASVTVSVVSDAGVTKTTPATIYPGNAMTYSIAYVMNGPSAAAVTIADVLPAETRFASVAAPGFTCTTPSPGANGTVSCTSALLAPGASGSIAVDVTVDPEVVPGTVISNTATAASAGDPNSANDSSTAATTVIAAPITGVKTVSTPRTVVVGSTITYTIVLHNGGALAQNDNPGDEFVDVLPPSLTLVSASATSGAVNAETAANTVHWNGAIAPGVDVTITIVATVAEGATGTIANRGTIHLDGDGDGTNESIAPTQAPGGGPTVFALSVLGVPALSPAMLLLATMLLGLAGWVAARH